MKKFLTLGISLFFLANSVNAQNSISGYIISLETAKPIPNATVFLNDKSNLLLEDSDSLRVTTDSTGFYKIDGIKADTYIINAWTTYHAMDQEYAMVVASDRIKVDHNRYVDIVFSEIAFKYRLDYKHRLKEARKSREAAKAFLKKQKARLKNKVRSSDAVAYRAIYPQIYIDSKRASILTWYIKNTSNIKK